MIFNSFTFLIFFINVTLLYFWVAPRHRWKLLLAASYLFYMSWNLKYTMLLLISTLITYLSGIAIARYPYHKKQAVFLSVVLNLAILYIFKYSDFTIHTFNGILQWFGSSTELSYLNLLLPVGISFYIFQALSYTIDVYKGRIQVEKNFFFYALFVSFFPQLVAGPIEKANQLLPQLRNTYSFSYDRTRDGLQLIIWGMFKKVVIANRLAIYVDTVYSNVESFSGISLAMASILFAIQIYCDFSGYSDIAIGISRIMGYELMRNFNRPYFAQSIGDFWHRWHISLSTWFQQYLYIPLGGNRVSVPRHYFNLFITFLVSGIWHGANFTFIVWGALHGIYLVVETILKKLNIHTPKENALYQLVKTLWVFLLVDIAWVFFRANTISDAWYVIHKVTQELHTFFDYTQWQLFWGGLNFVTFNNTVTHAIINSLTLFAVFLLILMQALHKDKAIDQYLNATSRTVRVAFNYTVLLVLLLAGLFDSTQFIYFQF